MNNKQLVTQLRDLGNAAQSLATAITMLYANLSINIPIVDEQQEQNTSHCGQDADLDDACCQAREHQSDGLTYRDILGMEVIGYGGKSMKCEGCPTDCGNCVKVELVGGDFLCLAKPEQEEKPVISFDEEDEQEDTTPNIMGAIKEKADDFMKYLDSVVKD